MGTQEATGDGTDGGVGIGSDRPGAAAIEGDAPPGDVGSGRVGAAAKGDAAPGGFGLGLPGSLRKIGEYGRYHRLCSYGGLLGDSRRCWQTFGLLVCVKLLRESWLLSLSDRARAYCRTPNGVWLGAGRRHYRHNSDARRGWRDSAYASDSRWCWRRRGRLGSELTRQVCRLARPCPSESAEPWRRRWDAPDRSAAPGCPPMAEPAASGSGCLFVAGCIVTAADAGRSAGCSFFAGCIVTAADAGRSAGCPFVAGGIVSAAGAGCGCSGSVVTCAYHSAAGGPPMSGHQLAPPLRLPVGATERGCVFGRALNASNTRCSFARASRCRAAVTPASAPSQLGPISSAGLQRREDD
jgi:hypothetical protein